MKYFKDYIKILEAELVPACGCTEPISLSYGAAVCRKVLGEEPEEIKVYCSGNIVKNVRCVNIPHSNGMVGIEAATALGAIGGDPERELEVLESVNDEDINKAKELIETGKVSVELLETEIPLHYIVELKSGENSASVEIMNDHQGIVKIIKNNEVIKEARQTAQQNTEIYNSLTLEGIKTFSDNIELSLIKDILYRQIECNMAIAEKGLEGGYGVNIGRIILENYPDGELTRMKAYAAAASEARMGGCEMAVIVNSGSGNQGICASVPVIVYAREKNLGEEKLLRGLAFSNLLTVYQKMFIGKLSAFCGVVSAGCASGAAVTYMVDGSISRIQKTIENTLANIPGIICDGAKVSCASKIASSIDAAFLSHKMAMRDEGYKAQTGILQKTANETIFSVGLIGKEGMKQTDKEILKIMLKNK